MASPARTARPLKMQALWVRVDQNRAKLVVFVVLFLAGSAVLITAALVALPGWLLGWGADQIDLVSWDEWFAGYPWVVLGALVLLLAIGGFMSAVQLANAEDWVRNRFSGRPFEEGELPVVASAVEDMALAAGLPARPALLLFEVGSVNACAIGTDRGRPVMGFTRGFATELTADEQRAVIATLTARIAAGDILFATALAALMGPIKAIRGSGRAAGAGAGCAGRGCADTAGATSDMRGCGDGCSGCGDGCRGCSSLGDLDSDSLGGCGFMVAVAVFLAVVAAVTYVAVLSAAWIVTLWGRALHRTSYEKADGEGMLLLKDPSPMLSALGKVIARSNEIGDGDPSYDGIFYAATSGTKAVDKLERRRYDRLREVLGTEGRAAPEPPAEPPAPDAPDD